jgi:hypothetical protein
MPLCGGWYGSLWCSIPFFIGAGEMSEERTNLIEEYERLRRLAHELDVQAETVDQRLIELERLLPDRYCYPGDILPRNYEQ